MAPKPAPAPEPEDIDELAEAEVLELDCPTCGDVTDHDLVRAAASGWTVQCLECQTTRTINAPKQERTIVVPVILSAGATASSEKAEVPLDGQVRVDDEFDIRGHRTRVTAIELPDGTRPQEAKGRDIRILYAVVFDTVRLRYAVNQGDITQSFQEEASPEEEVHVGTVREVQGVKLVVKTLKSDQNRTLHRGFLLARNVRRVFADLAPNKARAGQKMATRKRGAPKGQSKPRSKDKRPRGG